MTKTNSRLKFLRCAVIFALGLLIVIGFIIVPISYMVRPTGHNRHNVSGFYGENDNSLDMVYIGGSACFVYWEALQAYHDYGFTSYNYAANTIPPTTIKYCIKEVLKTQSPKLFVIDIRPFQYGDDILWDNFNEVALRNVADCMNYSTNRYEMIEASVPDNISSLAFHLDFLKYHTRGLTIDEIRDNSIFKLNTFYNPYKGFAFKQSSKPIGFIDWSATTAQLPLSYNLNHCLLDLLDFCKTEKLQVLFVVHSYAQSEEDKMKYNYIEDIVDDYGYTLLNTNEYYIDVGLDYTNDLYNEDHVNLLGSDKYTVFLSRYIIDHYTFDDKRLDPQYDEWETLYKEWSKQASIVRKILMRKLIIDKDVKMYRDGF